MKNWKWFGSPAHCVIGKECIFHLATDVGKYLVSTIGEYKVGNEILPLSGSALNEGKGYKYETHVFLIEGRCECGCGLPQHNGESLDGRYLETAKEANQTHLEFCYKWSNKKNIMEEGIQWADCALLLMALDNDMSRTSKKPEISEEIAQQAIRVGTLYEDAMSDFVCEDSETIEKLTKLCNAYEFNEWLADAFDGDISNEYFEP